MIELVELRKMYGTDTILKDISIKFNNKGLYIISGKSGSGKSTILNILSGIDLAYDGEVLIDGSSLKDLSSNDINYYRSTYVGYIFQDYNLIKELSVYDNIKIACELSNISIEEIDSILDRLNISHLKNKLASELSGGESQRVAIARCLVKHPKVILADEPTGALDKENANNIFEILNEISKDYLVIVVTHDTSYLEKYDSINYYIEDGVVTNSLELNDSSNDFKSSKSSLLKFSTILLLARKLLFKKKPGLVLSIIFVILSMVLLSVSISGINYDAKKSAYDEMLANNDYIVTRFGSRSSFDSTQACTIDYVNEITSKLNDDVVMGFKYSDVSMDNTYNYADFFMYTPKYDYQNENGLAFEYNQSTIDLFDLEIIVGNTPKTDNDCLMIDTLADSFKELGYKSSGIEKKINSYSDLIGLSIFGYNICGVVSCNKSDEYSKLFSYNKETGYGNDRYDDAIYCGCANSIFINKSLMKYGTVSIEYAYINEDFKEGNIYKLSDNTSSTIEYIDDSSSNVGAIVGASVILENMYSCSYTDRVNAFYETYKIYNPAYTDDELYALAIQAVKDEVITSVKKNPIRLCATSDMDDSYIDYYSENIIGVDFNNNLYNIYVSDDAIDSFNDIVSSMINVEALFYGAHNNDKTRNYAYELMEAQSDWSGIDTPYLSNHIIENYLDLQSTFNVLRTIFICLFVVFLCIGTFILYKHITDSIDFVEKDFGVLKAIGVKTLDIFRIINVLTLIISICVIALSFVLQYCGILLVNEITSNLLDEKFTSYYIDYRNYIVIFAVSAIVPLLITIYPVIKSSRRNPKDILNNN